MPEWEEEELMVNSGHCGQGGIENKINNSEPCQCLELKGNPDKWCADLRV